MAHALATGAAASRVVRHAMPQMVAGDHDDVSFSARWRYKDAAYGLKLASEVGQEVPISALAGRLFETVLARGWGALDQTKIIDALR